MLVGLAAVSNNVAMKLGISSLRLGRRQIVVLVLLVLALYVVLPQLSAFRASWHLLRQPEPWWVTAAVALTGLTFAVGAFTYCMLAVTRLSYPRTTMVQLAAMFVNRLLPSGAGALGVNYAYLRKENHSRPQSVVVVAVNNLLGGLGHWLLVGAYLLFFRVPGDVPITVGQPEIWLRVLLVIIAGLVVFGLFYGREKYRTKIAEIREQLKQYRHRPGRLLVALLSSMLLTVANVLSLLCCALALGVHLPFMAVLLIFTFGVGAGAAVPTPGGLGGFEAGLAAGFITYRIDASSALAVALLYRLVSYWLPLLPGAAAFVVCQRRHLFKL